MTYEVVTPDQPTAGRYTMVPGTDNPLRASTDVPHWAIALSALTGIAPEYIAEHEDELRALARQGGLGARQVIEGVSAIPNLPADMFVKLKNRFIGGNTMAPSEAISGVLDELGLPKEQNTLERVTGAISRGISAGGGSTVIAKSAAKQAISKTGADIAETLAAAPGAQATGGGAAGGTVQTMREAGYDDPLLLTVAGLLTAMGVPGAISVAGQVLGGVKRAAGAYAEPFRQSGQERVVGSTVRSIAENPERALENIEAAPVHVPGSEPTAPEASSDPGLLGLQKVMGSDPVMGKQLVMRAAEQNAARLKALQQISGTSAQLDAAVRDRAANAAADYAAADTTHPEILKQNMKQFSVLLDRPAFMQAWKDAETTSANLGMKPQEMDFANPRFMGEIKFALDRQIKKAADPRTSADQSDLRGLLDTQHRFLDVLDNINPQYAIARGNFAVASGPINKMTKLQEMGRSSELAAPDVLKNPTLSQAQWKRLFTDPEAMTELSKILTPDEMAALTGIGKDLDRSSLMSSGARGIGSNTYQNLGMAHVLSRAFGARAINNPLAKLLSYPIIEKPYQWAGIEEQLGSLLDRAVLDPKLMARLLRSSRPRGDEGTRSLSDLLQSRTVPWLTGGALTEATQGSE